MQLRQLLPRLGERLEIRRKRNARQLSFEVIREFLAITGMVQQAIDVMKDRPLVELLVLVVRAKLIERPIGYVLTAVVAVFVVDVEGEALGRAVVRFRGVGATLVNAVSASVTCQ